MKSTFTKIMIAAIMALVSSLAAEAMFQVSLASGGELTSFSTFRSAIDQANPRDTIFVVFDDGSHEFTIDKPIVVIGNPRNEGYVTFNINIHESDVESAKVNLEGLNLNMSSISSNVGTLEINNCFGSFNFSVSNNVKIGRLLIDRCRINNSSNLSEVHAESVYIRNSVIDYTLYGGAINENECIVVNSFVNYAEGYCSYINCLAHSTTAEGGDFQNSYITYTDWDNVQALMNEGCIGDDGTVAGPMGGAEPHYSLLPDVPCVDFENSNVEYDKATKKLKIKVKVIKE